MKERKNICKIKNTKLYRAIDTERLLKITDFYIQFSSNRFEKLKVLTFQKTQMAFQDVKKRRDQ